MLFRLLAIGNKMPTWVTAGFEEYAKRFPSPFSLQLIEIPAEKRLKSSDIAKITALEGEKLLAATKPNHQLIALDVKGQSFSTEKLAEHVKSWQSVGRPIDFLIGGPDGLSEACLKKSTMRWSLSPLTLPHPIVRIVLAEQLYRALMILQGHPYHRG